MDSCRKLFKTSLSSVYTFTNILYGEQKQLFTENEKSITTTLTYVFHEAESFLRN